MAIDITQPFTILLDRANHIAFASSTVEIWLGHDYEVLPGLPITLLLPESRTHHEWGQLCSDPKFGLHEPWTFSTCAFPSQCCFYAPEGSRLFDPTIAFHPGQIKKSFPRLFRSPFINNIKKESNLFTPDQPLFPVTRNVIEAQMTIVASSSRMVVKTSTQIAKVNLQTATVNWDSAHAAARRILSTQDPQERVSLTAANIKQNVEAATLYTRSVADIFSLACSEFAADLASHSKELQQQFAAAFDQATRTNLAGNETTRPLFYATLNTLVSGYERWTDTMFRSTSMPDKEPPASNENVARKSEKQPVKRTPTALQ
ncbi:phasin family protein [Noviherbaspirillum saxi]|nr:phasin family protein [Noviherbaspirillum saxi]